MGSLEDGSGSSYFLTFRIGGLGIQKKAQKLTSPATLLYSVYSVYYNNNYYNLNCCYYCYYCYYHYEYYILTSKTHAIIARIPSVYNLGG